MKIIKRRPQVWSYLYDNPRIVDKSRRVRSMLNQAGSRKLERLIKRFKPDAIGCTQAYPCGVISHYKKTQGVDIPLVGILTDYAPHSYWIHEEVDAYIVPSNEIGEKLIQKGVDSEKIKCLGTPIDPSFELPLQKEKIFERLGLSQKKPVILVMGGTHGIGPGLELIRVLDSSPMQLQIIVVTGMNKKLHRKVASQRKRFDKKIVVFGFVNNVHELMEISDIIITKPGGLTTAEALAKSLPIIILHPLPGQEDLNARILTEKGMAVRADNENAAVRLCEELLNDPARIHRIKELMRQAAKPHAAADIGHYLLQTADSYALSTV